MFRWVAQTPGCLILGRKSHFSGAQSRGRVCDSVDSVTPWARHKPCASCRKNNRKWPGVFIAGLCLSWSDVLHRLWWSFSWERTQLVSAGGLHALHPMCSCQTPSSSQLSFAFSSFAEHQQTPASPFPCAHRGGLKTWFVQVCKYPLRWHERKTTSHTSVSWVTEKCGACCNCTEVLLTFGMLRTKKLMAQNAFYQSRDSSFPAILFGESFLCPLCSNGVLEHLPIYPFIKGSHPARSNNFHWQIISISPASGLPSLSDLNM